MRSIASHPLVLWSAFILAHLWLGLVNLFGPGLPLGDVTIVYRFWADQVFIANFWVGIHSAWVYPILAIFPMLAADAFGPVLYASTWLSMILVLDAMAFFVLTRKQRGPHRVTAAWWWIAFLVLLGPIALGRIDSVTVPLAMAGALWVATRPLLASIVLTIAAWVKVWPAAILLAVVTALHERWRVLAGALGVSVLIVGGSLLAGSGRHVVSFVTQQTGRGLQVESPVSTIWLWQAFSGAAGASVYYDQQILTWQVTGNGTGVASALMTPIMALVVVALVLAAVLAFRRGAEPLQLFATLSLALVAALIAFNKVGSPQFISWLAVPIVVGMTTRRRGHPWWFATPALLVLVSAALTQLIYPYLYGLLLALNPAMLVLLSVRNLLVFVILGWAIVALVRLGSQSSEQHESSERYHAAPTRWPL